jgi:hypothetical protein
LRSQELLVDVYDGPTAGIANEDTVVGTPRTQLPISESTFRFIQLETKLTPVRELSFWMSSKFWILFSLAFIVLILGYLINRFVLKKSEDSATIKQRLAQKLAKKYLSSAKKAQGNQIEFYEALERALHNYLKAKLKIETTELSKAKIQALLKAKNVELELAKDFISVVENCELARYAPGSDGSIQADYERASKVMATIDRKL